MHLGVLTMKTARFWVWINDGWVKLSIPPGEPWEWCHAHPTDEGWSSESIRWTNDGQCVTREWCDDGVDCDGRLTRSGSDYCPIEQLRANAVCERESMWQLEDGTTIFMADEENEGIYTPEWEKGDSSVYDENAVLANY
jgi:hypothetical protein